MKKYIIILIPVLISVTAQSFIKLGMINNLMLWVVLGFSLFGISMFVWTKALSLVDLNFAYPFTSISYVLSAVSGCLFFCEVLSVTKIIGIFVISLGAVICAMEKKTPTINS